MKERINQVQNLKKNMWDIVGPAVLTGLFLYYYELQKCLCKSTIAKSEDGNALSRLKDNLDLCAKLGDYQVLLVGGNCKWSCSRFRIALTIHTHSHPSHLPMQVSTT